MSMLHGAPEPLSGDFIGDLTFVGERKGSSTSFSFCTGIAESISVEFEATRPSSCPPEETARNGAAAAAASSMESEVELPPPSTSPLELPQVLKLLLKL